MNEAQWMIDQGKKFPYSAVLHVIVAVPLVKQVKHAINCHCIGTTHLKM